MLSKIASADLARLGTRPGAEWKCDRSARADGERVAGFNRARGRCTVLRPWALEIWHPTTKRPGFRASRTSSMSAQPAKAR